MKITPCGSIVLSDGDSDREINVFCLCEPFRLAWWHAAGDFVRQELLNCFLFPVGRHGARQVMSPKEERFHGRAFAAPACRMVNRHVGALFSLLRWGRFGWDSCVLFASFACGKWNDEDI